MFSLWWLVDLAVTRHENHAAAARAAHYEQLAALPAATGQCKVVPSCSVCEARSRGLRGKPSSASARAREGWPQRDSLQAIMRQLAGLASPTSHRLAE
ncbi:hypothetical protein PAPYR_12419 [Paratrimastix pyriformis]|uniref:Uncharacterized protein n=1 Tax=Paratrimastix pyriformis TaxID=342808 RepID=A0ABQ8U6G1_9EUKA|nr:hypothetical protein PAPYR_12419 [Paratrimastix pyriformis]